MALINLRNALMSGKRTPTAKDYVQNGLVAMWDGIENAGWGVHDNAATVWKDLSGNNDLTLQNSAHFDFNSLVSSNRNQVTALLGTTLPYATIEACAFWDSSRNASALICFGNSVDNNRMLLAASGSMQIKNGWYQFSTSDKSAKSTWAGVHDGNSALPYKNGRLITSTPSSNTWVSRTGTFGLSGSSNYAFYNFVGNYYCVRLYSRALTAEEVARNYAIDKARFRLP